MVGVATKLHNNMRIMSSFATRIMQWVLCLQVNSWNATISCYGCSNFGVYRFDRKYKAYHFISSVTLTKNHRHWKKNKHKLVPESGTRKSWLLLKCVAKTTENNGETSYLAPYWRVQAIFACPDKKAGDCKLSHPLFTLWFQIAALIRISTVVYGTEAVTCDHYADAAAKYPSWFHLCILTVVWATDSTWRPR